MRRRTDDEMVELLRRVPYELLAAELARRNNARRKVLAGGRPKVLTPCELCGESFGAREMRIHRAACNGAKAAKKRTASARSNPKPSGQK